jgi:parvulin-like peptidyl-prolyl isomerase
MFCLATFSRAISVTAIAAVAVAAVVCVAHAADLPAGAAAIVNGVAIPQAKLDAAVNATIQQSRQPDSPQLRQVVKQQLVTLELFRQNAEKAGYGSKPEVQQAIEAAKTNAETQLYLKDKIRPEPVTDAQVKARYDATIASLGKDEYKPRLIVLADEATATTVLAKLKTGTSFDALAREYSIAPSKAQGGELPWVSFKTPVTEGNTQGLPLAVAQAITTLPAGAASKAIPVPEGGKTAQVIVKVDAKRPTQIPPYDQAKVVIRQQLEALALQQASAQFTAGLLKDAKIQQ